MVTELLSYIFEKNSVFLVHALNLFVLVLLIVTLIFSRQSRKNWTKINDYLGVITKTVNSIRYGDLTKKIEKMDLPNSEPLADSLNRMIETLYDREKMIVEYQSELNRQNKFLEAAIDSLSDGLIVIDENNVILRATSKIADWFKTSGQSLISTDILSHIQILNKVKNPTNLKDDDILIKVDKASNYTASSVEIKIEDKKYYILVIKNITDQRELESLKEDFVATLTHDLKVPIIAETNMIELFLNESFGKISEKQELALKNMQSSNKELLDLVQIVLETYKIKDNNIRLYKENIMLKGFIEEIIAEMQPIAIKTKNTLKFILPRDIRVIADRIQLKRVIKNLISNAISYGEPSSAIEITIGEIPKFIVISVKDYGAGISESDINKIFNKYYSAAKKFRKIGTGLGLYLSREIINAHGGELSVESIEGEFTQFTIKIPAGTGVGLYYGD